MPLETDDIKAQLIAVQKELASVRIDVKKIRRRMAWSSVYDIVKLTIIVGPLIWGYFYFQPQIRSMFQMWASLSSQLQEMQNAQTVPAQGMPAADLNKLLNQYPGLLEGLKQ